jgi:hypothetical protein
VPDGKCGVLKEANLEKLPYYNEHAQLADLLPQGVHECSPGCRRTVFCKYNKVLTRGMPHRPQLEVFVKGGEAGCGVWSPSPLAPGAPVATYRGELVTTE